MSERWELTDLEFKVLCDEYRQGEMPDPFTFTSRTRLADDYAYEVSQTRRALRDRFGGELSGFGGALAKPDIVVTLQAWDDQDFDNPKARTRAYALRQRARGFVITQRPGETMDHSGGFDIVGCDPRALADTVLGLVPFARAGRLPDMPIPDPAAADRDRGPLLSFISDNDDDDDGSAYTAAFLNTPATGTGYVQVSQGRSKFGPRGIVEMGLLWRDLPDDGRYVIPLGQPEPSATAMGTKRMIEWVDEQVAVVVARLDRNMETEE
ncbi:ESX secretion-associated protein EspG [Nocardia fusca]|uniref:ESX secretion-associated protein EspG n=1 Tax=Nocardia fusca TaxID=941183 RepID=A0ABV3F718_9NOCA|nr:ESX secretion-associated protein EspG [Nocardia fusca]